MSEQAWPQSRKTARILQPDSTRMFAPRQWNHICKTLKQGPRGAGKKGRCRITCALAFCVFFFGAVSVWAQELDSDRLFSTAAGELFYEIAYEIAHSEDISRQQAEQAVVLLSATIALDPTAAYVVPENMKLTCRHLEQRYDDRVYRLLVGYVNESADLEVISEVVRCLLGHLDSREAREKLLQQMVNDLGGKNTAVDSELATLLGLLAAEKADTQTAESYFMQAYDTNRYNKLAFAKLAEIMPEQITPPMYLTHLRVVLSENPLDIEAALTFAEYAERLQLYKLAADSYEYCAQLFGYLKPSDTLPGWIYRPWAISSYNTQRGLPECLQIAQQQQQSGQFDLLLQAIAGKAATKIGADQQAEQILKAAEEKALQAFADDSATQKPTAEQLAWFYCFALPDPDKAIDWANKAYSTDPNSDAAAAILAYSLVANGQTDLARPIIEGNANSQIAELALAQIQLMEQNKDAAIATLKSVIARDPGSLAAERAKQLLAQLGSEYIAPVDPANVLRVLRNSFGRGVIPSFVSPENMISVELNIRGNEFAYGREFSGSVAIANNSAAPLIISDNGLINGNIRIDANITGDLDKKIPSLISFKTQPALPIKPGRAAVIPVRLVTGELRRVLLKHPQASLETEFTLYIDPVATEDGTLTNRLTVIKPVTVIVKRPGVQLSSKYLQTRLNSISQGQPGQKIEAVRLFAGLLDELQEMANHQPSYRFMCADWMPDILKSALFFTLRGDDWIVKVHTIAAMLSMPLDYDMIDAVAANLNNSHWPVRLMALYLLAKNQGNSFKNVLDHTAKYDSNRIVRTMAIALGGVHPQPQQPANQPISDTTKVQPSSAKE